MGNYLHYRHCTAHVKPSRTIVRQCIGALVASTSLETYDILLMPSQDKEAFAPGRLAGA